MSPACLPKPRLCVLSVWEKIAGSSRPRNCSGKSYIHFAPSEMPSNAFVGCHSGGQVICFSPTLLTLNVEAKAFAEEEHLHRHPSALGPRSFGPAKSRRCTAAKLEVPGRLPGIRRDMLRRNCRQMSPRFRLGNPKTISGFPGLRTEGRTRSGPLSRDCALFSCRPSSNSGLVIIQSHLARFCSMLDLITKWVWPLQLCNPKKMVVLIT